MAVVHYLKISPVSDEKRLQFLQLSQQWFLFLKITLVIEWISCPAGNGFSLSGRLLHCVKVISWKVISTFCLWNPVSVHHFTPFTPSSSSLHAFPPAALFPPFSSSVPCQLFYILNVLLVTADTLASFHGFTHTQCAVITLADLPLEIICNFCTFFFFSCLPQHKSSFSFLHLLLADFISCNSISWP